MKQTKPSPPLNFGAPETLTSNPDPPTSLADTETAKFIKLKALADQTPDGFSTEDRIIRNAIPGTGLTLPAKRTATKAPTKPQPKHPKVHLTESLDSNLESDPKTLDQAMKRAKWPQWKVALEAEYASLWKHDVFAEVTLTWISCP